MPVLLRAIDIHETDRLAFSEAYLEASGESTGINTTASFDRSTNRGGTAERIEPQTVRWRDEDPTVSTVCYHSLIAYRYGFVENDLHAG